MILLFAEIHIAKRGSEIAQVSMIAGEFSSELTPFRWSWLSLSGYFQLSYLVITEELLLASILDPGILHSLSVPLPPPSQEITASLHTLLVPWLLWVCGRPHGYPS